MEYEQMEMDFSLESEKSIKDNMAKVIQFLLEKRKEEAEIAGREISEVKNKHEGYGIASEAWARVLTMEKNVKGGMGEYLSLLQVKGEEALQVCGTLYDAALNLACEAAGMAADMSRILEDLYYKNPAEKTPLEEIEEGLIGEEEEFEEAEEEEAEDDISE